MYEYAATLVRVVDGDTIDVNLDLGFRVHFETRIRLARINAPERYAEGKGGKEATAWLTEALPTAVNELMLRTAKPLQDKYGRYLAEVFVRREGNLVDVNAEMVAAGHAVWY